jgi:hypothetical protein
MNMAEQKNTLVTPLRQLMLDCAAELEHAATLRAGLQDSESKQQALQQQVRETLKAVAARLRAA